MKRRAKSPGRFSMVLARAAALTSLALVVSVPAVSAAETGITCHIQQSSCVRGTEDGMKLEFDIRPKPVTPLSGLTFIVTLMGNGKPVDDATVSLELSMPGMFMGTNRPVMKGVGTGRYEGTGVITRCQSGRKTWQAKITVEQGGKTTVSDFVFEVN